MKTFNLLNEIIVVDRTKLFQAINSGKPFGITYQGEVVYPPFPTRQGYIFQGTLAPAQPGSALAPQKPASLAEMFGYKYRIVEDEDRVLIKAGGAWQELIELNKHEADYDDSTGDGIDKFEDPTLEEIGWHATEFHVPYRDIVDEIEKGCDGLLFCIEREGDHYQFSGFGFIHDIECARKVAFDYCQGIAKKKMQEDADYRLDMLTDDEQEAAEYFKVI